MNLPYFIAKRIARTEKATFSRFITRLSVVATALSVAVMIIAVAVVEGFKGTIQDKIFVFWGHFHVAVASPNPSSVIGPEPIDYDPQLVQKIARQPGVTALYPFAVKPAIISNGEQIEGIKLKGVDRNYPFKSSGGITFTAEPIRFSDSSYDRQIIVSTQTLQQLNRKTGDSVLVYFVDVAQGVPSIRKLQIAGTFHTGVDEIDQAFALCDIRMLRRVSNWNNNAIQGYQVVVSDYRQADSIAWKIYQQYLDPPLTYNTIGDIYPDLYNWLSLIDVNTQVIILIMSLVAIINIATALLIFIMERTNMVGVLKALGMNNEKLWLIFLHHASRVAIKGILIGALIGVGFCLLQQYTQVIQLNESTYYIRYVPIKLIGWEVAAIITGTFAFCIITLTIPALLVRKINTVRALHFK